jgi:hypothetical protein
MNRTTLVSNILVAATLTIFGISPARATLLFADSFDYPTGSLNGDGPPAGSPPGQGPWASLNLDPQVTTPGLQFIGIHWAGNAATLSDTDDNNGDAAGADLTPVGGPGSGPIWIGFLIQQDSAPFFGYAVVGFNDGFGATSPGFGVLDGRNVYGIDNDTGLPHSQAITRVSPSATTVWLVVKLDFAAGMEFLFVNPTPGTEPIVADSKARLAMTPEFQASGFDRIILKEGFNQGSYTFDELRVGTKFGDLKR